MPEVAGSVVLFLFLVLGTILATIYGFLWLVTAVLRLTGTQSAHFPAVASALMFTIAVWGINLIMQVS